MCIKRFIEDLVEDQEIKNFLTMIVEGLNKFRHADNDLNTMQQLKMTNIQGGKSSFIVVRT